MTKWLAVIGSRKIDAAMERDIREAVELALEDGWSIVSGGSTGADCVAARTVYESGLATERLKLYLPLNLELYAAGFRQRVARGVADADDTEQMIALLKTLQIEAPQVIHDDSDLTELTPQAFHRRNDQILACAERVLAFRCGKSTGTDATISKARRRGLVVEARDYDHID